jgi:hypothetical protein
MVYHGLSPFSPRGEPEIALTLQLLGKLNIIWKVESPIFSCFFCLDRVNFPYGLIGIYQSKSW